MAQDLDIHIGSILYNYHEWLTENGLPDVILGRFIIDYPALYERALYDYVSVLKDITPQYGFQFCYSGTDSSERSQIEKMNFMKPFIRKPQYMNGNRSDSMKKCYEILERNSLINEKEGYGALIRGYTNRGKMTLGAFLKNAYVKKHMKPAYYSVMDMLFSTDKLDIRNSIMHGISLTFDPYAMCNTAVMLQLFWQIMDRNVMEICV